MVDREKTIALVRGVQQGRNDAVTELYQAFYSDIYYFILKNVNNDTYLAEDLTQDTFVEIMRTIQNLQEPAAFFKWSHQIAYHRCTAHFRKRQDLLADAHGDDFTIFSNLQEDNAEFIPDEALEKEELKNILFHMLQELPEEQRSALILRYFNEISVKDIADIQGVSEGTVKSRLNYGRKSMKQAVESYEKRNGINLHCAGVIPLLLWLFREYRLSKKISLTAQFSAGALKARAASTAVKTAAEVVTSAAEVKRAAGGVKAVKNTASVLSAAADESDNLSTAAEVTGEVAKEAGKEGFKQTAKAFGKAGAKTAAKAATKTLATKIVAGFTAATLVTGGAVAAPKIIESIQENNRTSQSQKQEEEETKVQRPLVWNGYGPVFNSWTDYRFDMTVEEMDEGTISGHFVVTNLYKLYHETDFTGEGVEENGKIRYHITYATPLDAGYGEWPDIEMIYDPETEQMIIEDYYEVRMERAEVNPKKNVLAENVTWSGTGEDSFCIRDDNHQFVLEVYEVTDNAISGKLTVSKDGVTEHISEFTGRGYCENGTVYYYETKLRTPRKHSFGDLETFWLTYYNDVFSIDHMYHVEMTRENAN